MGREGNKFNRKDGETLSVRSIVSPSLQSLEPYPTPNHVKSIDFEGFVTRDLMETLCVGLEADLHDQK